MKFLGSVLAIYFLIAGIIYADESAYNKPILPNSAIFVKVDQKKTQSEEEGNLRSLNERPVFGYQFLPVGYGPYHYHYHYHYSVIYRHSYRWYHYYPGQRICHQRFWDIIHDY